MDKRGRMATGEVTMLRTDFLCQICNTNGAPQRNLDCHHNFCQSCLGQYLMISKLLEKDLPHLKCLVCENFKPREREKETIATNSCHILNNSSLELSFCEPCTFGGNYQTTSTHRCIECVEQLCQSCAIAHRNMKALRGHSIVENDSRTLSLVNSSSMQRSATKVLDIKARLPSDGNSCYISGALFTKSGNILLVDFWNKKLKLFGVDGEFMDSHECKDKPWDLAPLGKGKVAVTFPEKNIIKIFKVKKKIVQIENSSKIILLPCLLADRTGEIRIEKPTFTHRGLYAPLKASEEDSCLFAISFACNDLLINKLSEYCESPSGADLDHEENIYVSDYKNGCITMVSKDRRTCRKIVENLKKPLTVRLNQHYDKFLVTCKDQERRNFVEVYTLK